MRVEIYGGSDDLIEYSVDGNSEEYNVYSDDEYMGAVLVTSIGGAWGVKVNVIYDGCWSFAIGMLEEDKPLPTSWKYSVERGHAYSTKVIIDTDEPVVVTLEEKKK